MNKPITPPAIASFECTACGTTHNAPAGTAGLPVGWSAHAASAWCASCTAAGIPARDLRGKRRRAA